MGLGDNQYIEPFEVEKKFLGVNKGFQALMKQIQMILTHFHTRNIESLKIIMHLKCIL